MDHSNLTEYQDTRPSGDQTPYMYLDIPDDKPLKVNYEFADFTGKEELDDGYEIYHIYLNCSEIQDIGLPLEANPREPAETPQVRAMRDTLEDKSNDFVKKNNGVVTISSDIDTSGDTVTFEFISGEGICNGGHTYFAIQTVEEIPETQQLHLEALVVPENPDKERKEIITDIAKARNNSNELSDRSEADFMGYYEPFQDSLIRPELIRWRENDSDARSDAEPIDAVHFLRLLICLDVTRFSHPVYNEDGKTHKSLATSRSKFHRTWMDNVEEAEDNENQPRPLQYLLPLVNDVMYIRDVLSYTFPQRDKNQISIGQIRKTNLYTHYIDTGNDRRLLMGDFDPSEGTDLRDPLEVMLMGLFRSNLYCSHNPQAKLPRYVGWLENPKDLWYTQATKVLSPMADLFKDLGDDPKQFIRISSPFNHSLYQFGMSKDIQQPPSVLYDVNSGARYQKVEDRNKAEYWLEKNDSGLLDVELQLLTANVQDEATMYSESNRWENS